LLGRKIECDLVINDPSFSREQTSFTYDPTKECWLIKDGGSQSLGRTGTWYLKYNLYIGYLLISHTALKII